MTTLGPPFSCLNNNSREATFLWLNFPRKLTTQLTTRMENYYDKSLLWRYKEQSKVKPFKLSWATAGCDWQSHSVCDALYSQQTLKFATLWGPPPNDANRTWADTPTAQGSIFFFLEKMQRHPLWLLHWKQGEFLARIPRTDSCLCVQVWICYSKCTAYVFITDS